MCPKLTSAPSSRSSDGSEPCRSPKKAIFAPPGSTTKGTTRRSLGHALGPSWGTLCFGSAILTITETINGAIQNAGNNWNIWSLIATILRLVVLAFAQVWGGGGWRGGRGASSTSLCSSGSCAAASVQRASEATHQPRYPHPPTLSVHHHGRRVPH